MVAIGLSPCVNTKCVGNSRIFHKTINYLRVARQLTDYFLTFGIYIIHYKNHYKIDKLYDLSSIELFLFYFHTVFGLVIII